MDKIFDIKNNQKMNKLIRYVLKSSGYREVGTIDEDSLYTDDNIKKTFINIISSQSSCKAILSDIVDMVDKDIIIPVYVKPGLINRIKYFFFKEKQKYSSSSFVMAFFNFSSKKMIVLVENIQNMEFWKKDEALSLTLLHEFQHMTSWFFPNEFLSLHSKSLAIYYKQFFNLYFTVDISLKESFNFAKWVHLNNETKSGQSQSGSDMFNKYYKMLSGILDTHYNDVQKSRRAAYNYLMVLLTYLKSPSQYVQNLRARKDRDYTLFYCLLKSYKSLNIIQSVNSICIQEIIFPSEIICVESEYNTSNKHFQLVKKLKTIR